MDNKDLALFLGMLCGDGHLSIHHKKRESKIYYDYVIGFCNIDKNIMESFQDLFYKLFGVRGNFHPRDRLNRRRIYEFNSYSKEIFDKISSLGFPVGVKRDILKIPKIISESSKESKLKFFYGVLITDGCIRKNKTIIFHSGSKLFLEDLSVLLHDLFNMEKEVKSYIQREKYISYQLNLNKEESQKVLLMPPSHNGIAPVLSSEKFDF